MAFSKQLTYACNCFWLLVPILAFNMLLMHRLPAAYQMEIFWKAIPTAISLPENILRMAIMILPVFMRFGISTPSQKLGLCLYLAGLLAYFTSWMVLIVAPQGAWSTSEIGFMAPAFTPILWLIGIGLIGNELLLPCVSFKPWMYGALSALFLVFHNLHTALVYSRGV